MAGRKGTKKDGKTALLAFVLDKSGSMDSIRGATISGFNEYKNDQARQPGKALMSLMMFDTDFVSVCGAVPIAEVDDLTQANYKPGGCTALYDAIAHTVRGVDEYIEHAERRPDKVLVVIMTDGQENSSREFDRDRVFRMITDRQDNRGYEFVYLGANQDSYVMGRSIGVAQGRMMNWHADEVGASRVFMRMSEATSDLRKCADVRMPDDWLDPDELIAERAREGTGSPKPQRPARRPRR